MNNPRLALVFAKSTAITLFIRLLIQRDIAVKRMNDESCRQTKNAINNYSTMSSVISAAFHVNLEDRLTRWIRTMSLGGPVALKALQLSDCRSMSQM
jgi:hypothetical protein